MLSAIGIAIGIPFLQHPGGAGGGGSSIGAISIALAQDIKVFALITSNQLNFNEEQNIALSYNLEL